LKHAGYQSGLGLKTEQADVRYDSRSQTGFALTTAATTHGWGKIGGTRASAPQWDALSSIAEPGPALYKNQSAFDGVTIMPGSPAAEQHLTIYQRRQQRAKAARLRLVTGRVHQGRQDRLADLVSSRRPSPRAGLPGRKVTQVGQVTSQHRPDRPGTIQAGLD